MTKSGRWIVLLLVAAPLLLWLPRSTPRGPGAGASPDLPDVDRYVADRLAAAHLPGAALAVTRGEEVVHVRGFGRAGDGGPVEPDTQFRIGSLTKAFTATAVLQLVEAGRVNLDAPVRDYLPEFQLRDRRGDSITVRHLLNHTSGLADAGFPEQTMAAPADLAHRVTSLRQARLVSPPGTKFHYFNPNYDVLARLIEVVAGQPYEAYLRSRIFDPLGMRDTLLAPTGRIPAAARSLHDGYVLVYGVPVDRPELDGFLGGNGAVVSTAADLARWLIAQGGYGAQRLLRPSSLDLMHTPPPGVDTTYGMGWMVERAADGSTRLTHNGVLSTYEAEALLDPRTGVGVALLFNSANGLAPYHSIIEGVADILAGRKPAGGLPFVAVEVPLACLTVLVLAVRAYLLARSGAWADRRLAAPLWRVVPGLLWLLVPTALLIALPAIVATFAGRVFSRHQLLRSMPSVHGFLGAAAVTGLALAAVRVTLLVQRRRLADGAARRHSSDSSPSAVG